MYMSDTRNDIQSYMQAFSKAAVKRPIWLHHQTKDYMTWLLWPL